VTHDDTKNQGLTIICSWRWQNLCRHLEKSTKHARCLWLWSIRSIIWKRDIIHKTGSTVHNV